MTLGIPLHQVGLPRQGNSGVAVLVSVTKLYGGIDRKEPHGATIVYGRTPER
jgi:hypothetical protein